MKIAHLSQYFQPKLGYNDLYLPMKQQAMGHEVCVITSDRYMPSTRFFGNIVGNRIVGTGKFYEEGILTYRLPCLFERESVILTYGIKKALGIFKPDVVHCHDIFSLAIIAAAFYKESLNFALVVDSITGTFDPRKIKRMAYLAYKYFLFPYVMRKADVFCAINEGSRSWLQEKLEVLPQNIELIPLGADMDLFKYDSFKRGEIRKSLELSDGNVLIVYSGKMLPEKDITTLILAVASLPDRTKNRVRILLVGSGPNFYTEEVSRLACRHELSGSVHFHPPVHRKRLSEFYSAADIGVWPGSPSNSIIEAMSAGLPIIIAGYRTLRHDAHDTSNLLEYHNGLSFVKGSAKELAACIEKLVEDEKLRCGMGVKSRKLVEDKLNWGTIARKTLEAYQRVMSV